MLCILHSPISWETNISFTNYEDTYKSTRNYHSYITCSWRVIQRDIRNLPRRLYSFVCFIHTLEKAMALHSSTLAGGSHGWRSLVGHGPWGLEESDTTGREESDTTERLHFHFSLSCIGEGNGNPLQCSCLENPRDGGASWAAVYGVAQSRTRLKWLSSSSSSIHTMKEEWSRPDIYIYFIVFREFFQRRLGFFCCC